MSRVAEAAQEVIQDLLDKQGHSAHVHQVKNALVEKGFSVDEDVQWLIKSLGFRVSDGFVWDDVL